MPGASPPDVNTAIFFINIFILTLAHYNFQKYDLKRFKPQKSPIN
jgi:hypothetical protein